MYAQGFVNGLMSKLRKANEDQKKIACQEGSRALILVERRNDLIVKKTDAANRWLKESAGLKLRKGTGSWGANGSTQAWREGVQDGMKTDVNATRHPKLN